MANKIALGIETDDPKNYQQRLNNREKKVAEAVREDENIVDTFDQALCVGSVDQVVGTVFTGAAAEVVSLKSNKAQYEMYISSVATGAAVAAPYQSSAGLELKSLAGATGPDSYELGHGTTSLSKAAYTVGSFLSDKKIFMEANILIDDISDVTEMWFGWRKAEAYQATDPDAYDEMAAFVVEQGTDVGRINIDTILNNAATSRTDTTEADWADTKAYRLRIEVDNAGKCKFLITAAAASAAAAATAALAEPAATANFSFDSGEVIIPFLRIDTEIGDPGISVSRWEVGYM
jgi:hypothetical protein